MVMKFVIIITISMCIFSLTRSSTRDVLDEMLQESENGNIDAMFDKIGDVLGDLVDTLDTIKAPCKYKCPNGATPREREGHIKSSNGCGTQGFDIDTSSVPAMTDCCDSHDYCYDTCNADKEQCDETFKTCLHSMCDKMEDSLKEDEMEGCKATAELMYTGSNMLGCNFFKEAQSKACDCGREEPEGEKIISTSGKSTLTHERISHNATPIKESQRHSKKDSEYSYKGKDETEENVIKKSRLNDIPKVKGKENTRNENEKHVHDDL